MLLQVLHTAGTSPPDHSDNLWVSTL